MFWVSLISAIGLAILLVEKSEDWPVSVFVSVIKQILSLFHKKLPDMLFCTICTTFWTALLSDLFLLIIIGNYFLWPLTGFAAAGCVWAIYQLLNSLEKNNVQEEDQKKNENT